MEPDERSAATGRTGSAFGTTEDGDSHAVYVASPLGFTESGREYYASTLLPALRAGGYTPLDPWSDENGSIVARLARYRQLPNAHEAKRQLAQLDAELAERNLRLIEECSVVLAILDGPDVDSGTAAEIGYASALRRPIVGLRSDIRRAGENDGTLVNLQVSFFIERAGGHITSSLTEALAALATVRAVPR